MGDGQFDWPTGVAVASDDSVYVSDSGDHSLQKFTSDGTNVSKWGTYGTAGNEDLNSPLSL